MNLQNLAKYSLFLCTSSPLGLASHERVTLPICTVVMSVISGSASKDILAHKVIMSSLPATSTSFREGLPLLESRFPLGSLGLLEFLVSDNTVIGHYSLQITVSLLEGTSRADLVQRPQTSRVAQGCPVGFEYLHGYSTTSPGDLFQCSTAFTVK